MPPSVNLRRSSAARTERNASPAGWIGAAALHAGIIAAMFFTWSSHNLDITDQSPPVVPVDLVTIGPKTNIAPMVKVQPKEPPKEDAQPPAPEPTLQATPSAPQQEESAPPPPKEATAEPILKKPPPPPAVPKTKPQPDEKKEKFDINNIAALLDKRAPAPSSSPNAKVGPRTIKGIGQQNAMTMDLVDSLRNQIAQCWSPPVGAPNSQDLVVDFDLFLNPDGSIAQPPQLLGNSATASSPYARAAIEAARRAIYTCAPYKLPADRYSQWREINPFHFDPRGMMGQ